MSGLPRSAAALVAAAALLVLGACSDAPEGADEPGAVVLERNIPHDLGPGSVVAHGLTDEGATISVPPEGDGELTTLAVKVGDEIDIYGTRYRVHSVDPGAETGSDLRGAVVLVEQP